MKNSIQLRLTLAFTLAFSVVAAVAGGVAFYDTYRETNKLQDDLLQQISGYINPTENPTARANSKNDARVFVHFQPNAGAANDQFPQDIADGFHTLKREKKRYKIVSDKKEQKWFYTLKNAGDLYRTFVRSTPQGKIIITQENEYREDLATRSAWSSVIPLAILLPLLILLTVTIVQYMMRPVRRLSQKVEQRHEQDLTPLSTKNIPSEIKGFVAVINNLLERTGQFIQQQKRFIADASHELRSPMTALSLQIEQLANMALPPPAQQQLQQVQQGIRRSRDLLEQLLSLTRIQNTQREQYAEVSLPALFRRVIEDTFPLAAEKNLDIGVTSTQDVALHGNETHLYLLIKTLVDNAIRYTPPGSQIDLSAVEKNGELIVEVEDNGNGIPVAERKRVFDPFYRILGTEQQGSGLGLAIAAEIVKSYGGSIRLDDSTHFGSGLLVTIRLPR